ncbi:hypothetical protein [Sphingomonas sp. MMS24-J13]|uniref:hypothetical protein n=1 Tax=Sphingomonas sp. MMS24-J13 TaxID=3238686 RepID=UPI00384EA2BB
MKAQTMRSVRQYHRYFGIFFTPAIIFFALSGALQTLGLHESHDPAAPPIAWIEWMGSVHKDQRVPPAAEHKGATDRQPGAPQAAHRRAKPPEELGPSPIPLKAFVLLLALGLITSSALGAVIALNSPATRRMSLVLLALGTVLPVLLLYI